MRRSGLMPLVAIVLLAVASLTAVFATDAAPQLGLDLAGGFSVTLQPVEETTDEALDQAIEIIRTRVDAIGVGEPEITRQGDTIVVNLPGVTDRQRATELVGQTAELRFRPVLCDVTNAVLALSAPAPEPGDPETGEVLDEDPPVPGEDVGDEAPDDAPDDTPADAPGAGDEDTGDVVGQSGSPAVPFQDDDPAPDDEVPDDDPGEEPLDEVPLDEVPPGELPPDIGGGDPVCQAVFTGTAEVEDLEVTERDEDDAAVAVTLEDEIGRRYRLGPAQIMLDDGTPVATTGEMLADARAQLDTMGGQGWMVAFDLHGGTASRAFDALAAACFNTDPTICPASADRQGQPAGQSAIVLDSDIISVLTYGTTSFEGSGQITGQFTEAEAKDLALVLRYGALPVALEIQTTEAVSPTLGRDTLRGGLIAGAVGLAFVALYMVAYYRLLGLVAVGSLVVSGALLWTVIAWLGETQGLALSLAGIVGIVVSIGVAVDSNVVFYENLKEEVSRGRTVRAAVGGAFTGAWGTIVKADVATLIGAGLLYWLTVGPVRGFAFFLGLATLLDLVASWFFMRPLVLRLGRAQRFQERPRMLGLRAPEVAAP